MDPKSALGGPKPISRTGVRCAQDRTLFETPMVALAIINPKRQNLSSYLVGIIGFWNRTLNGWKSLLYPPVR